jgi:hypothetical protein
VPDIVPDIVPVGIVSAGDADRAGIEAVPLYRRTMRAFGNDLARNNQRVRKDPSDSVNAV